MNLQWFNASPEFIKIWKHNFKLFNLFNHRAKCGHYWGVGIIQVGQRHLFYIGDSGLSILFLRKI
jgi:hypothetical protein